MEFERVVARNSACFERRGFDFADAVRAFSEPRRIVARGRRRDPGEDCHRRLGTVDGRVYDVVCTVRVPANRKEVADQERNARQN